MNDNVRKVFELLGVEPNEEFMIDIDKVKIYHINEDLRVFFKGEKGLVYSNFINISDLLCGEYKIIKLPKKKKLRDLTGLDYWKWQKKNCTCYSNCEKCVFNNINCSRSSNKGWFHHKDLYSDKFLDQEIEVPE